MFILKTGHQPGVYVPLRALFLVLDVRESYRISHHFSLLVRKPETKAQSD